VSRTGTLIVDTSFLGDVLCAEPMVRAAADQWPAEPIDFLTSVGGAMMLEGHPQIRNILVFDKRGADKGLGGLLGLAKRLRQTSYQRAICSHRSWRTAALLATARIPSRTGFDNASAAWLYTNKVAYRKDLHEVERNLQLFGGGEWTAPRMYPGEAEKRKAEELLPAGKWVAMAPGSIWATKRWPMQKWAELLRALSDGGQQCLLMGGPDDQQLCAEIQEVAKSLAGAGQSESTADRVLDLSGKTTLRESAAVLERCAVMVSNDSAPMHLGVSAGIPVVAVFCSTIPAFGFAPRGVNDVVIEVGELDCRPCGIHGHKVCPKGHFKCGEDVGVGVVFEAAMQRLSL
jgi:heptosyltransferase II